MLLVKHLRLSSKTKCLCSQLCLQTGLYLPKGEEDSPWALSAAAHVSSATSTPTPFRCGLH